MGELNADRGVLALHEGDQRLETFDLGVVPDAEIMLIDEADLLDRRRLDEDQPKAAQCVAAEMHDMEGPAAIAGVAAIVDHRRNDEAVLQREASDGQRLE